MGRRRTPVAGIVGVVALFTYGVAEGVVALFRTLMQPWPPQVRQIPLATFYSSLRLIIAYAISLGVDAPVRDRRQREPASGASSPRSPRSSVRCPRPRYFRSSWCS